MDTSLWPTLLALPLTHPSVQEAIHRLDTLHKVLIKPDSLSPTMKHLFSYQAGISLQFLDEVLQLVFLYGKHDKQFQRYPYPLDSHLTWDSSAQNILSLYGEPDLKEGGGQMAISISYDRLGTEFCFKAFTWEDPATQLAYICYYPKKEGASKCGVCRKVSELKCSRCSCVYYCSQKCQRTHWTAHRAECK